MSCVCEMHIEANTRRLRMHVCILKSYLTVETFSVDVKTWKEKVGLQFFFVKICLLTLSLQEYCSMICLCISHQVLPFPQKLE